MILLLLYFVRAFIEHADDKVRLHALSQTIADDGVSRDPLKSVAAFWVQCPRLFSLTPEGFVVSL